VEHRSTDEDDLSDSQKLLQRVYSMNILRLEGKEPDLQLWTVSPPSISRQHSAAGQHTWLFARGQNCTDAGSNDALQW
jgi:hypothetical protein